MGDLTSSVLITGVSSGIGFGLAQEYLARGWRVYGLSRRTPDALVESSRFHFQGIDLTDEDQTISGLSKLLSDVGRLDLVILNAGILGQFGDMGDIPLADMKRVMEINLWSNKRVLDFLFDTRFEVRQVVTISSGASVNGNRGWAGYSISKAALNMLTRLYAQEHPATFFCALAPGLVDTAIQDELMARQPDDRFPAIEVIRSKHKTPDMPTPQQLAGRLVECIEKLPEWVESGDFADIRKLPET